MSFFFAPKDAAPIEERIKLTQIHVDQQKEENADLRKQINDIKDSSLRSKVMLDELIQNTQNNEKTIEDLKLRIQSLENTLANHRETEAKLQEDIDRLNSTKESIVYSDYELIGTDVQESLNKTLEKNQNIYFKDSLNQIWQVVKKPDFEIENAAEEEETQQHLSNIEVKI